MKIKFIVSVALLMALAAIAEDTNELFITLPDSLIGPNYREDHLNEAKTNRESLPAKQFPEGNWGEPGCGFQLSLRFERTTYTNGEPITAIILVRNITNDTIVFFDYNIAHNYARGIGSVGDGGPVGITMVASEGKPLNHREQNPSGPGRITRSAGAEVYKIFPTKSQRKYFEYLNQMYDLTNGIYSAHAVIQVGNGAEEVKSAEVPIKIVGK
jgi:hypothetical protein